MTSPAPNSYSRILRSSAIIGGAEGIGMVLGLIRTKFAALLIGTAGIGILGNYTSIQGLVSTIAGLGIRNSAVRDIAQAVQAGDDVAVGRTITALRRVCWGTGLLGMVAMIALSQPLSRWTFGSEAYALDIAFLGVAILFANLSGGQSALIQGHQRIGDLARVKLVTGVSATILTVMLYALFGTRGIMPAILGLTAVDLAAAWFYARRIPVKPVPLGWLETIDAAGGMLRLGLVFMWAGLLFAMVNWITRVLITNQLGIEAVGVYTAAYVLSLMAVNYITGAMAADYYPRLASLKINSLDSRTLINSQIQVGLLLAIPIISFTIVFAPWIIPILYSDRFLASVDLLQLMALASIGRLVAWPLVYVMPASGMSKQYFIFDTTIQAAHLFLLALCLPYFGLPGVATASLLIQVPYVVAAYLAAKRLAGFFWQKDTVRLFYVLVPQVTILFSAALFLSRVAGFVVGLALVFTVTIYCLKTLIGRSDFLGTNPKIAAFLSKLTGKKA